MPCWSYDRRGKGWQRSTSARQKAVVHPFTLPECPLGPGTWLDAGEAEIKQADRIPTTTGAYILVVNTDGELVNNQIHHPNASAPVCFSGNKQGVGTEYNIEGPTVDRACRDGVLEAL